MSLIQNLVEKRNVFLGSSAGGRRWSALLMTNPGADCGTTAGPNQSEERSGPYPQSEHLADSRYGKEHCGGDARRQTCGTANETAGEQTNLLTHTLGFGFRPG